MFASHPCARKCTFFYLSLHTHTHSHTYNILVYYNTYMYMYMVNTYTCTIKFADRNWHFDNERELFFLRPSRAPTVPPTILHLPRVSQDENVYNILTYFFSLAEVNCVVIRREYIQNANNIYMHIYLTSWLSRLRLPPQLFTRSRRCLHLRVNLSLKRKNDTMAPG